MTLTLSGSAGIVNPQGTAQTPAIGIGTNTAGIYWPNAAIMGFTVNGAEAMRVDQQGNVLIGTTTNVTASKLTVRHFGSNSTALAIGDTNTASSSTGLYFYTTSTANISVGTGGALTFNTQGGAVELMRLNSSGNLGIGSNAPVSVLDMSQRTDAVALPVGNSNQRPSSPVAGMSRYNSSTNSLEWYNSSSWITVATYNVQYLIVGGGGSGGTGTGGGGGAGGVLAGWISVQPGVSYTVVVGAGASSSVYAASSNNGSYSSALGLVALGGGGGGGGNGSGGTNNGFSGGSGGGGWCYTTGAGANGLGTAGQGNSGGGYYASGSGNGGSGGGGGAGAVGVTGVSSVGGAGGSGVPSGISGTFYYYGGGGGATSNSGMGNGGLGGGGGAGGNGANLGSGGTGGINNGVAGTGTGGGAAGANTGGGGGANWSYSGGYVGGAGGSGIVYISYANSTQRATGGTVTSYTSGGLTWWVHTFNSTGTFTFTA